MTFLFFRFFFYLVPSTHLSTYTGTGQHESKNDGDAVIRFALSDSLTSFRVVAEAFAQGSFGTTESFTIVSEMPLRVDITTPTHLTRGDRFFLPVTIETSEQSERGEFQVKLHDLSSNSLRLQMEDDNFKGDSEFRGSSRIYIPMSVQEDKSSEGSSSSYSKTNITVSARSLHHQDAIRREVRLLYPGFPVVESHGGLLARPEEGELRGTFLFFFFFSFSLSLSLSLHLRLHLANIHSHAHQYNRVGTRGKAYEPFVFTLPRDIDLRSLEIDVTAYPTPVGSLTEAIRTLIREPCGCFEQTSATTYPLIMALMYLKSHRDGSEKVEKMILSAEEKLRNGYKKLVSYESADGGFEWFGASPGHEALTAYGIAQFRDLEYVLPGVVDSAMMSRTKRW